MPTTTTMAAELAKVCRICRYADGVCTIGFRKTPPSWFDFHGDCTSGTGKGECAPSPGAATWKTRRRRRAPAKDSGGRARNRRPLPDGAVCNTQKTAHAVPAGPAGQMDSPGHSAQSRGRLRGQYRGGTLSTEEREEYERYLERFHKRCKLGGKADRLVRIVDRYMPRIAEENRIFVMRFPDKVEKMLRRARGIRRKIPARRRQQQGEAATPPKDEPPEVLRPANMGEDAEQHNDGSFVEDTPPDSENSHEDLDMAETQERQSREGEEAGSPANPWPWGPEGRPSDTGRSQGVLAERPAEPARAPQPTGETPTAQRGHPVTLLPNQRWHEVRQVQARMAQFSRHRAWQTKGPQ